MSHLYENSYGFMAGIIFVKLEQSDHSLARFRDEDKLLDYRYVVFQFNYATSKHC